MPCRPRRLARRLLALAPVLAALGGQALAASSLRAPFLPHAGTTPAPWFTRLSTDGPRPTDGGSPPTDAGVAALRAAVHASRRPDLEARLTALLATVAAPLEPRDGATMSESRNIAPPGGGPTGGRGTIALTR